jgi:hypothetical protein
MQIIHQMISTNITPLPKQTKKTPKTTAAGK